VRVSAATEPGSTDVPNEDWWGATSSVIVVLDGVSMPAGMSDRCRHGTPWYVRQLGARVLAAAENMGTPLEVVLAGCIGTVADLHPACDPDALDAPSAAVAILRIAGDRAEYLALADVTIALETADAVSGIRVITDDRVEASTAGVCRSASGASALIAKSRAAYRNRAGGYWVAAGDPAAAVHAVTGQARAVRRVAVMTDGAALIHEMAGAPWPAVLDMSADAIISRVRTCERSDPERTRWPRWKVSDDATAVFWQA
jgi:hypothetical protein